MIWCENVPRLGKSPEEPGLTQIPLPILADVADESKGGEWRQSDFLVFLFTLSTAVMSCLIGWESVHLPTRHHRADLSNRPLSPNNSGDLLPVSRGKAVGRKKTYSPVALAMRDTLSRRSETASQADRLGSESCHALCKRPLERVEPVIPIRFIRRSPPG
ncbi:hypothetical protein F5B21DRAFT_129941 [Xylaria acuta]|nr:hypothetical protein F5B21DRAFT_129941 [Xylaria acuta]